MSTDATLPLVSIITAVWNREAFLKDCINSLIAQDYPNIEYIVVDGGSTDRSLDVVRDLYPQAIIMDDRRKGLYDAINMGIERATGVMVGLLNSDDVLRPNAIQAMVKALQENPTADSVCGYAEMFDSKGIYKRYTDPRDLSLDLHAALCGSCMPNARFYKRDMFKRIGFFSTDYRYVADRDWLVRAVFAGMKTVPVTQPFYGYCAHDGSLTFNADPFKKKVSAENLKLTDFYLDKIKQEKPAFYHSALCFKGRNLFKVMMADLTKGHVKEAMKTLWTEKGTLSLHPLRCILQATADKAANTFNPNKRMA